MLNRKQLLILCSLLLWASLPALAASKAEMQQWQRLQMQARTLFEQEKYEQALQDSQKALELANAKFGKISPERALSYHQTGLFLFQLGEVDKALPLLEEAQALASKVYRGKSEAPERIMIMQALAEAYGQSGQMQKAVELFKEVYSVQKKRLGLKAVDTQTTMNSLAENLRNAGEMKEAEQLLRQAFTIIQEMEEPDGNVMLRTMENLAAVTQALGNYGESENLGSELVKIKSQVYGPDHYEVFFTTSRLGETKRLAGKLDEAEGLLNKAVAGLLAQGGKEDPEVYLAKSYLGALKEQKGDYDGAMALYKEVYAFDKATLGENHPNSIIDLNTIAGLYRRMGDYAQAERDYVNALEKMKEVLGPNHPETITLQNNLGLLMENRGFFEQAEPLFTRAFQSAKLTLGETNPKTLALMNNLALLYESQGVFAKSEPLYQKLITFNSKLYGPLHENTLAAENNLGYLYLMEEEFAKALPYFEKVYNAWSKSLSQKHPKTLKALNNQARALHRLGKLQLAETKFNEALRLRKEALGDKHPDVVRSQTDLAALYTSQKRYDEAGKLLRATIALSEEILGDKHQYTFDGINNLADMQEAAGLAKEALTTRQMGFERRSDFFNKVLWGAGENTRQAYISLHKFEQDKYLNLLLKSDRPDRGNLVLGVSLQRKGLILKIASEIQKVVELSKDPKLAVLADRLTRRRKLLANMTLAGPENQTPEEFQKQVQELEAQINEMEAELGNASQRFKATSQKVSVEQLLEKIGEGDALIDYLAFEGDKGTQMMAVVMLKEPQKCGLLFTCYQAKTHLFDLGPLQAIHEGVKIFRETIQDEEAEDQDLEETAKVAYDLVWAPLKATLANRKSVYIVPDSALHLLPFDAMINEEGKFLVEEYEIKTLSSGRDLVIPPSQTNQGQFMIMAGPDYNIDFIPPQKKEEITTKAKHRGAVAADVRLAPAGLRTLSFDILEGAEVEGETIQKVAQDNKSGTEFFLKKDAEEQKLRDMTQAPRILHIATHGFFLKEEEKLKQRLLTLQRGGVNKLPPPGDNPLLRAGLAFAGINANAPLLGEIESNNDGVLTAMEVLSLNLQGTQLVVLSACETGVGEIHAGEGVYGLRRSFQEAGVRNVVNSLWPVSDEATRSLMTGFYQRVFNGMPTRQALRESQLALLKDGTWGHPYFWSAFVLVGRQ